MSSPSSTPSKAQPVVLRDRAGQLLPLEPARWHGTATAGELRLLARLAGPVLDVGCGPGRLLEGLARRGVPALGVDTAPDAVRLARARGCVALQRSIFAPLPGEGRWRALLLLDGNLGIGGDPVRLLRRCAELIGDRGAVVAEVEPPETGWRTCEARLEHGDAAGGWFGWSVVGADAVGPLAAAADLALRRLERLEDRWFAHLAPPAGGTGG